MWLYNGNELSTEDIPESAIGFLYRITYLPTNQKYIGRKLLTKAATKKVKGKVKRIRKQSDWQDYWSSSPLIHEMIEKEGTNNFKREILLFCDTKSALNYAEEKVLYAVGALESDLFLNSNIRSKVFKKHFTNQKEFIEELNYLILKVI